MGVAYIPLLRGNVHSGVIIVLQEAETIENVHDKSDRWELHINASTRFSGYVLFKCQVDVVTHFQLRGNEKSSHHLNQHPRAAWSGYIHCSLPLIQCDHTPKV